MVTKSIPIKDLKPGYYVIADGEPCRVASKTKSKPGKHGAAKMRVECMGIFDNRRRFILKPAAANVEVPIVEKKKAQVISISGDIAQLMDLQDYSMFETTIPEEFRGKLQPGQEITIWIVEGRIIIKE